MEQGISEEDRFINFFDKWSGVFFISMFAVLPFAGAVFERESNSPPDKEVFVKKNTQSILRWEYSSVASDRRGRDFISNIENAKFFRNGQSEYADTLVARMLSNSVECSAFLEECFLNYYITPEELNLQEAYQKASDRYDHRFMPSEEKDSDARKLRLALLLFGVLMSGVTALAARQVVRNDKDTIALPVPDEQNLEL